MIRCIERKVSQLTLGDRFSLDDGATYHTCASINPHANTIAVQESAVVVDITSFDQPCLVEVELIRVSVPFTLEVDVKGWAQEFALDAETPAAVRGDVKAYFAPENLIPDHLRPIVGVKGTNTALDPVGRP
jgi:hypothetical protein